MRRVLLMREKSTDVSFEKRGRKKKVWSRRDVGL